MPRAMAMTVRDGYREYRRLQHALRLNGPQYARVGHGPRAPYIEAKLDLWKIMLVSGASSPACAQT